MGGVVRGNAFAVLHPVNVESVAWIFRALERTLSLALVSSGGVVLDCMGWPGCSRWGWNGSGSDSGCSGPYFLFAALLAVGERSGVTVTLKAALLLVVWWKRGAGGGEGMEKGCCRCLGLGFYRGRLTAFIETNAKYIRARRGNIFRTALGSGA